MVSYIMQLPKGALPGVFLYMYTTLGDNRRQLWICNVKRIIHNEVMTIKQDIYRKSQSRTQFSIFEEFCGDCIFSQSLKINSIKRGTLPFSIFSFFFSWFIKHFVIGGMFFFLIKYLACSDDY